SPAALHLPPGEPGRLAALAAFATSWRPGQHSETWRFDDPAPFFRESRQWLSGGPPAPAGAA
ncbi:MAG: hypothetical protein MUC69_11135, partial [Gemmatimonadales bacterium]|nr:hypothetical protein [Gemmatimonadales bacterium]